MIIAQYHSERVWYSFVLMEVCLLLLLILLQLGSQTSVGDKTVISTVSSLDSGFPAAVHIGDFVTIEAGCSLTSCRCVRSSQPVNFAQTIRVEKRRQKVTDKVFV